MNRQRARGDMLSKLIDFEIEAVLTETLPSVARSLTVGLTMAVWPPIGIPPLF